MPECTTSVKSCGHSASAAAADAGGSAAAAAAAGGASAAAAAAVGTSASAAAVSGGSSGGCMTIYVLVCILRRPASSKTPFGNASCSPCHFCFSRSSIGISPSISFGRLAAATGRCLSVLYVARQHVVKKLRILSLKGSYWRSNHREQCAL